MDIKKHKFPEITKLDLEFSTLETDKKLLKEAKLRGFKDDKNPYRKLFTTIFYEGGKIKFKKDVDEGFKKKLFMYIKAYMSSYAPKHEEKEMVCALLMSEIMEPKLQKETKPKKNDRARKQK